MTNAIVIKFKYIFRAFALMGLAAGRYFSQCIKPKLQLLVSSGNVKIIIGSSATAMRGWISTEYPYVDITDRKKLKQWFDGCSVTAILAEHVFEHLDETAAKTAAGNIRELLVVHGYIRIAVPDGYHPDLSYIDAVKPGGIGDGSDDHKVLYNIDSLTLLFEQSGFLVKPLEWFDESGVFHSNLWSVNDGMVTRSSRFDGRNFNAPLSYTSLIIDAIKT